MMCNETIEQPISRRGKEEKEKFRSMDFGQQLRPQKWNQRVSVMTRVTIEEIILNQEHFVESSYFIRTFVNISRILDILSGEEC